MSDHRRRRMLAGIGVAAVAVSACGTTLPISPSSGASDEVGASMPQLSSGAVGSAGATTGAAAAPLLSASSGVRGGASTSVQGQSLSRPTHVTGRSTGGGAVQIPTTGRGWTAKTVSIGLTTFDDAATASKAVGVNNFNQGDNKAQAQAVANYYNARGGLFGRKIVVVQDDHATANDSAQPEQQAQASCTKFTQDHPVVAVINPIGAIDTPNYRACLTRAGVPLFSFNANSGNDDQAFREYRGLLFSILLASWTGLAPMLANRLVAQGYFHTWDTSAGAPGDEPVRVGILMPDDAVSARVYTLLSAALKNVGHAPAFVYRYSTDNNFAQESSSAAVLQMRANHITHIIGLDGGLFLFMTAAESQHFRPRYGLTSTNAPGPGLQANAPAGQQGGAMGVGSTPGLDVDSDSGHLTPGENLCLGMMAANGQTFDGKRFAQTFALSICDSMRLIAESALAGGGFTDQAIHAGAGIMGPKFAPASTFASGVTSAYSVLPAAVMDLRWQNGCSCYRYSGGLRRL